MVHALLTYCNVIVFTYIEALNIAFDDAKKYKFVFKADLVKAL